MLTDQSKNLSCITKSKTDIAVVAQFSHSETQDGEGSCIVHIWLPGVIWVDIKPGDWEKGDGDEKREGDKSIPIS